MVNSRLNVMKIPPPLPPISNNVDNYHEKEMEEYIRDKYERKVFISSLKDESVMTSLMPMDPKSISTLQEMGFFNRNDCVDALLTSNGDISMALEILLSEASNFKQNSSYTGNINQSQPLLESQSSLSVDHTFIPKIGNSSPLLSSYSHLSKNGANKDVFKLEEAINVLEGMGFNNRNIRNPLNLADSYLGAAFIYNNFSLEATINELVENQEEMKLSTFNEMTTQKKNTLEPTQRDEYPRVNLTQSFSKKNESEGHFNSHSQLAAPISMKSDSSTSGNPNRRTGIQSVYPSSNRQAKQSEIPSGVWRSDFGNNNTEFEFDEFIMSSCIPSKNNIPESSSQSISTIDKKAFSIENNPLSSFAMENNCDRKNYRTPIVRDTELNIDNPSISTNISCTNETPNIQPATEIVNIMGHSSEDVKDSADNNSDESDPFAALLNL